LSRCFSISTTEKEVRDWIRNNFNKGYSKDIIAKALLNRNYKHKAAIDLVSKVDLGIRSTRIVGTTFVIFLFILLNFFLFYNNVDYFGHVTRENTFEDIINFSSDKSTEYMWLVRNPVDITSIKINGGVSLNGTTRVYIENDEERYLIFDSEKLKEEERLLEIDFIKSFDEDKASLGNGNINLEYATNSEYGADNDGIANIDEVIDFTVANTEFDFDVNYSKLCTVWYVESIDDLSSVKGCYGNEDCCGFLGMDSSGDWDEPLYLNYGYLGATYNNIVSAQILYYDYSIDLEDPYSNLIYSSLINLTARF